MIYRNINGKIELIPEAIRLVPVFDSLSEKQIRFLIIAYDYTGSPFKMKPEDYRIDMAEKITGLKKKDIPESIKEEFISCIYDMKRERKQMFQRKLISLQRDFETETNTTKLKESATIMGFIENKIDEMDNEIIREEEMNVILKGDRSLSFLEKMIRNRKLYNIEKKNKEKVNDEL
jgi:hypothetical protein